jgi:hypothetical protein
MFENGIWTDFVKANLKKKRAGVPKGWSPPKGFYLVKAF